MRAARVLVAGLALVGSTALGVVADTASDANDVLALNYALQLEHLEAAFYARGYGDYSETDFTNAGVPASVRSYIGLIAAHEAAHVTTLSDAITNAYGKTASSACTTYSFTNNGFSGVKDFLAQAIVLEGAGVSAYAGALNAISNQAVAGVAATIATVEARHASYLRQNVGNNTLMADSQIPFPTGTDTPATPMKTVSDASSFFVSGCSYNLSDPNMLPAVRPNGTASATTLSNAAATSSRPNPAGVPPMTQAQFTADTAVLNYALTLEHLEASFYDAFASYTAADFESFATGKGSEIYMRIGLIRAHERAHVNFLTAAVKARGVDAVAVNPCYNFTRVTNVRSFIELAAVFENTGVSAYDGAAGSITDTTLQQAAATVATVEARHAAYINGLLGRLALDPDANLDTQLTSTQVVTAIAPFYQCTTGSASFNTPAVFLTAALVALVGVFTL